MTDLVKREEEAKENHWGIYCAEWADCEKWGICREECPGGGMPKEGDDDG